MKLAIIQMESVVGEVGRNVDLGLRLLDQAAASGAEVALLPEYWSTGFFPASRDYRRYDLAAADDGRAMTAIRDKAVELGMHVVATIFERDGSDLCYDTAMLVGPDGRIAGKYRKTHIAGERHIVVDGELVTDLGIESIYFRTGMRFPVFGIGEWRVGIMLCYDTYFPEAARCLALAGAEVILAPFGISDTKKTIWKELLAARAFENIVYLAAANNVGYVPAPDMPIVMGGHSIAIDPYGEELAMASYDRDEVLRVDLDRDHLLRAPPHALHVPRPAPGGVRDHQHAHRRHPPRLIRREGSRLRDHAPGRRGSSLAPGRRRIVFAERHEHTAGSLNRRADVAGGGQHPDLGRTHPRRPGRERPGVGAAPGRRRFARRQRGDRRRAGAAPAGPHGGTAQRAPAISRWPCCTASGSPDSIGSWSWMRICHTRLNGSALCSRRWTGTATWRSAAATRQAAASTQPGAWRAG